MPSAKCCFCGAVEEVPVKMTEPVVCDRAECVERAKLFGWSMLLEQFIETKRLDDGTIAFRVRADAKNDLAH